jgi:hypothetical protein
MKATGGNGHRARAVIVAVAGITLSCGDEGAFVVLEGSVTRSDEPGARFDPSPNPEGLPPIADALVRVCGDAHCMATSGGDGNWGPVWRDWGLLAKAPLIEVHVEANGYEPLVHRVASRRIPAMMLNVRLRRSGAAPPRAGETDRQDSGATP